MHARTHTHAQTYYHEVLDSCTHLLASKIHTTCWHAKYSFYSCKNNASLQPVGPTKSTKTKTLNGDKWWKKTLQHQEALSLPPSALSLCLRCLPLEGMCITLETLFRKPHFISYSYIKHNLQQGAQRYLKQCGVKSVIKMTQ